MDSFRNLPKNILYSKLTPPIVIILLTFIYTYPLPLHLSTQIIGPYGGDSLECVWRLWWVKHAIFDPHQSPFILPNIYAPYGYLLAYGEITPIHTFIGLPVTILFGPIAAYNLFILFSFILTGYFMYLFMNELLGHPICALFASVLFTFCNFRMGKISSYLNLMDTQWIVLCLFFLERYIKRLHWKYLAYASIFFVLAGLSTMYYPAMMALIIPPFFLIRMNKIHGYKKVREEWRSIGFGLIVFVLIGGVILIPTIIPYIQIQNEEKGIISLAEARFWSADLSNYLIPNPKQYLWKDWISEYLAPVKTGSGVHNEFVNSLGYIGILFAIYGFSKASKNVRAGWGWWINAAFILSLGPELKFLNTIVGFPVSENIYSVFIHLMNWIGSHSIARELFNIEQINHLVIPLPALFVRWFIPGYLSMRAWGRFSLFVMLGVAVWAGYGAKSFIQEEKKDFLIPLPRKSIVLLCIFFFLSFFESYNGPQNLYTPKARSVDIWLANHDQQATIIQMPMLSALSGTQMFYSQYNQHPVASGYGTFFPIIFSKKYPTLEEFPSDLSLDVLLNWGKDIKPESKGVEYILVDEAEVMNEDPLWNAIRAQKLLVEVTIQDGVHVYKIQ